MFGPNLAGEEPHWTVGCLFATAMLFVAFGIPAIALFLRFTA